jgi:hypothetical protein
LPCDSIVLSSISVQNLDRAMLKRALSARKIAYRESRGIITTSIKGQEVTVYPDRIEAVSRRGVSDAALGTVADELRVIASTQAVYESAEENGFTVQEQFNESGEREYVLERQVF